jgi:hypothetical protein
MTPCLWAAWVEIASLSSEPDVATPSFSSHWMAQFYCAHAAVEAQQNVQVDAVAAALSTPSV